MFDPDFVQGEAENFSVGIALTQLGKDDLHPSQPAGFLLPAGNVGDEFFLWLMVSENVEGGTVLDEAAISITQHDDDTGAQIGVLDITTYHVLFDNSGPPDGLLVVAHGERAFSTEHGQIQILFSGTEGVDLPSHEDWVVANLPAGTYPEIANETWWDGTPGSIVEADDFVAGDLTFHFAMPDQPDDDSLAYATLYRSGSFVAGVVVSWWDTNYPVITYPAGAHEEVWQDGWFYSFKPFVMQVAARMRVGMLRMTSSIAVG